MANSSKAVGDIDGAVEGPEEAIRLLRELDPDDAARLQRIWLAELRAHRGDPERARAELLDMVAPAPAEIAPADDLAMARVALGELARHQGDLDEAAAQYGAARDQRPAALASVESSLRLAPALDRL